MGRGDPQRQRQVRAQLGQLGQLGPVQRGGPSVEDTGEQGHRLVGGQRGERHPAGPVHRGQAAQVVAAGDQHRTAGIARQQRPDLVRRGRVVQHQQQPPAGQQRAEHGALLVGVQRDLLGGHAQRAQEPGQHVHRGRCRAGRVAAQVHVELPVREPVAQQVGHVHGERGLANARWPGQGDDRHGRARLARRHQLGDPLDQVGAADEVGDVGGQLGGHLGAGLAHADRLGRRRPGQVRVAEQDRLVQRAQLGAGRRAQLLVQQPVDLPERVQRLGLAAGPVQRQHQLAPEPLAQRVLAGQRAQLAHQERVPAHHQLHVDALFEHAQPLLGQPRHLLAVQQLAGHVGQGGAAPQVQRLGVGGGGLHQVAGGPRPLGARGQVGEQEHVDALGGHLDLVAVGDRADDRRVAQGLPQPHHVGLQGAPGPGRRRALPQPLDQFVHAHGPVGAQQQRGEQHPVLAGAHRGGPLPDPHLQRPEKPELRTRTHARPLASSSPCRTPPPWVLGPRRRPRPGAKGRVHPIRAQSASVTAASAIRQRAEAIWKSPERGGRTRTTRV